jgi:hypothetical protein
MPKMILPPRHDWCGQHHDPDTCPVFGPEARTLHDLAAQALAAQNYVLAGLLSRTLDDLGYQLRRAATRGGRARVDVSYHHRRDDLARAIRAIAAGNPYADSGTSAASEPVPGVPPSGCDCLLDGGQGLAPAVDQARGHADDCPASDRYTAWLASWEQCPDRPAYASAAEHRRDCPTHQAAVPVGGDVTPVAQVPAGGLAGGGVIPATAPHASGPPEGPAEQMIAPQVGPWFGPA